MKTEEYLKSLEAGCKTIVLADHDEEGDTSIRCGDYFNEKLILCRLCEEKLQTARDVLKMRNEEVSKAIDNTKDEGFCGEYECNRSFGDYKRCLKKELGLE